MSNLNPFSEEVFRGLPKPALQLNDISFDGSTDRKYTRSVPINVTPEMYQAVQELVQHRNMSSFGRHALGIVIEALEPYMNEDIRTLYRSLMAQQLRLTRERIIVTIDENIDQQVETMRFWTTSLKWDEVLRTMEAFVGEIESLPVAVWKEHAANTWLRHKGLRGLVRAWQGTMKEHSPDHWQKVEALYHRMDRLATSVD